MTATADAIERARVAAKAAIDKLATSVVAIDVTPRLVFTDAFVIASGETSRQVKAIVEAVDEELAKLGVKRLRREGDDAEAHWVLTDYGDIVVHVQQDEDHEYYALEKLWGDCPRIDISDIEER